ncbi:hypothetical protein [Actinoplanes sp. NBRC 103695]|uniref:hypothetical protein n=1 Tax=Actinoplanes sp. NBRC 103695 TaxID=3032202 RepID=UPI00255597C4|nr:hypothetical protein [Actinoplanes sp. NBRC 103695]
MDTGLERTPANGGFLELPTGRPPLSHRPRAPRASRSRPLPPPPTQVPGRPTGAGWSFLDGASVLGPTAAGFVVEVAVDTIGFRVAGRPARPPDLAAHLAAICPPARSLLLAPSGVVTSAPAMTLLLGSLVDALGRPVVVATPDFRVTATGLVLGGFRRFHPRSGRAARRIDDLGPALPIPPTGLAPAASPVRPHPPVRREPAPPSPASPPGPSPTSPPGAAGPSAASVPPGAASDSATSASAAAPAVLPPSGTASSSAASTPTSAQPTPAPAGPTPPVITPRPAGVLPSAADPPAVDPSARPAATPQPGEAAAGPTSAPSPIDAELVALLAARPVLVFANLAGPATAAAPSAEPVTLTKPVSAPPAVPAPAHDGEEPATGALWLPEAAPAAADRGAVRQALNGRYDAHARIVARRLSEDPGLRAVAGSSADITAGLVAVRAYLLEERDTVNRVLRGDEVDDAGREQAGILARTATYGLHRLPSVFGPVFHATAAGSAAVSGYRPGDELVEPAFLDVDLTPPAPGPETSVEIAIWSVSARRVGGLEVGDAAALFPPGSRFAVLAVDRSDEAPPRVLLRDLSAVRRGGGDDLDRILSRLRDAPRNRRAPGGRPRSRYAPGLDDSGRRYRRPDPTAAGT